MALHEGHLIGVQSTVSKLWLFNFQGVNSDKNENPWWYGGVAQLGEHLPCKQGVMGSNPIISTIVPLSNGLIAQLVRARA